MGQRILQVAGERGPVLHRVPQHAQVIASRNFNDPEAGEMRGDELGVEQAVAAGAEARAPKAQAATRAR